MGAYSVLALALKMPSACRATQTARCGHEQGKTICVMCNTAIAFFVELPVMATAKRSLFLRPCTSPLSCTIIMLDTNGLGARMSATP